MKKYFLPSKILKQSLKITNFKALFEVFLYITHRLYFYRSFFPLVIYAERSRIAISFARRTSSQKEAVPIGAMI